MRSQGRGPIAFDEARIANGGDFLRRYPTSARPGRLLFFVRRTTFASLAAQGPSRENPCVSPNCDFGSVRRRARYSAALGRQGAILSPYLPPPLSWPICAVGAVVVTATAIISAPLRALTGAPPFYYRCYGPPPDCPPPAYLRAAELFWATLSPPVSRR